MRNIALLWAITTALIVMHRTEMAWWHPACNVHDDGGIDFGYGFPFPYWTYVVPRATSAGWLVMPHMFVLNVAILAAIVYPLYGILIRPVIRWKIAAATLLVIGLLIFLFEIAPIVLLRSEFYPVRSIAASYSDESYFSFRPAGLAARQGKRACPA